MVNEIVNSIFTSKTYILWSEVEDRAWLVDIGDIEPVLDFADEKGLHYNGVLLTHSHFDHIYGLPSLIGRFPECKVYTTEYGKDALASSKLNLSRYQGVPIEYKGDNVVVVQEGDSLRLFDGGPVMQFYETPGHNPGCLTMVCGDVIFTGDSYIPGVGVTTRLPHSDKDQGRQSLERILKLAEGKKILAGHAV